MRRAGGRAPGGARGHPEVPARGAGLSRAPVIVTAGPTREWIDAVRFISNPSSGRMGYAVAAELAAAGHAVCLVSGPTALAAPEGVERVEVETVDAMRAAVLERYDAARAVVMAAAVGDWRPAERIPGKWKKQPGPLQLTLVRTPDILAELGRLKRAQVLVGFALETEDLELRALAKLREKNLDYVVANAPDAFAAERSELLILAADGAAPRRLSGTKEGLARAIAALVSTGPPPPRR